MCRMNRLTGTAIVTSFIPVSVFAGTTVGNCWGDPVETTQIDEALGNYPPYSCNIGYGGSRLVAPAAGYDIDPQVAY